MCDKYMRTSGQEEGLMALEPGQENGPISVSNGVIHIRDMDMEVGRLYLVEYKSHTLGYKKPSDGESEIYKVRPKRLTVK